MNIPTLLPPTKPSTNVLGIGYDKTLRKLYIEFKFTGIYRYDDCDPKTYEKLLEATSIGQFIASEITPKHFYEKLSKK